jgi:cell division protein FtsB
MKCVAAFGLCVMLFTMFAGGNSLPALLKARRDAQTLTRTISELRSENAQLKARAAALRNDPSTIEAVARETLGLARADELIVTRPK